MGLTSCCDGGRGGIEGIGDRRLAEDRRIRIGQVGMANSLLGILRIPLFLQAFSSSRPDTGSNAFGLTLFFANVFAIVPALL